ncbi:hypothetical protein [Streptomyces sp. NPDC048243]|uniref:hypothetical protein n=1 Tax=Streptomyces sp. NPDC048243 TaxID=3365522 RepID=UPI00371A68B7
MGDPSGGSNEFVAGWSGGVHAAEAELERSSSRMARPLIVSGMDGGPDLDLAGELRLRRIENVEQ